MNPLIGAVILVLLGLLGARLSFTQARAPLGPRLILSAGTHFLFLGFLLGSHILGLLTPDVIDQLYPFLALGIGWIGLLFGLQLDRRQLGRFPLSYLAIMVAQAVFAFAIFYALGTLALHRVRPDSAEMEVALLVAAATACISTPAGIGLISHTFLVRGRVSRLLFFIASLDALIGIIGLQFTYAFHNPGPPGAGTTFGGGGWPAILLALGLGLIFGLLFLWLTRPKPGVEELVLFLFGLVVFAAGSALYLGLSPLFVSVIAGAVIANLSPLRRRVYVQLQTWEKPIYVILLILAGARLNFPTWVIVPLAAGYLAVRALAKVSAGFLATRLLGRRLHSPTGLGIGLIPQGGISLAMAISMTLIYGTLTIDGLAVVDVVFSTVVLGVVVSELIGPFLTRNLLRRAGEISPRVETAVAAGAGTGELARAARKRPRGGSLHEP